MGLADDYGKVAGTSYPAETLTPLARLGKISGMRKSLQAAWFVALSLMVTAPVVRAQVPERIPSPPIDPDWTYTSPGPKKCVEIGNLYLHRGNLKGALSRFQEAIADNPNYAPAYLGLGRVYERLHEKRKALEAYQRYLDELPTAKQASEAKEAKHAVWRLQREVKGSDK